VKRDKSRVTADSAMTKKEVGVDSCQRTGNPLIRRALPAIKQSRHKLPYNARTIRRREM
jgi:hypothetical protein